jgi:hypothetical protein
VGCRFHLLMFTPGKHYMSTIRSRNMHQKSRAICDPAFILLLLQRVGTRLRSHAILLRCAPRNADRADDFAIHQQWQPALNRNSASRRKMRRPSPPAATASWNALVGRLKSTAERALPIATLTLPVWVPSIFSK